MQHLEHLELILTKLEHTKDCPVTLTSCLCECGLSEGRRRLYSYIDNKRIEQKDKINENETNANDQKATVPAN
jgi:hypothetical protein